MDEYFDDLLNISFVIDLGYLCRVVSPVRQRVTVVIQDLPRSGDLTKKAYDD